jgi:hypothetical protein
MGKAYSFLWDQSAKAMQSKVEGNAEFESKIKGDPIELLKTVKSYALNYHEHRYEMAIIFDSLHQLINLKQRDGESLIDYTKQFKTAKEVMISHIGGPIILTKFVKTLPNYEKDEIAGNLKAFNQLAAYMYLENSDKSKYGSIMTGLETQQSLKNNQYPKTLAEATNVLSTHRFDYTNNDKNSKSYGSNNNKDTHKESKDTEKNNDDEAPEMSFANIEGKCYCCGKGGHRSPTCRLKDKIPKEEWAINKAKSNEQSHAQFEEEANLEDEDESSESQHWCGTHVQFYQADEMRRVIILDNGSTVNLFCNDSLVHDITPSKEILEVSTNAGDIASHATATVPGYGKVWFNPNAITNIFSFAQMEDKYRITYDSAVEKAFMIHLPDRQVKFKRSKNGLYRHKPTYDTKKSTCKHETSLINHSIESVEENKLLYTARQLEKAKLSGQIYHAMGAPSITDFKAIVQSNMIKNLPITIEDIKIAEDVYGPDIGSLKGKTTRTTPAPVVADYIEIPQELIQRHDRVTLCIDGMKINGVPFLTTISRHIMYRTAEWIPNQTSSAYRSVLEHVFRVYQQAGFTVTTIMCDNEFKPLMHDITSHHNIEMNYANPQEHVPEVERNIRVIKERFRTQFHRLPFTMIPKVMIKVLTMECAKKLNFFPPKGSLSAYYSPRMILHKQNLDYNKHCTFPFGSYVQAHNEPNIKNSMMPRTLDCIYLRYVNNQQGGHNLLDLRTGKVITRRRITLVPIIQQVIDTVHKMATADGFTAGLKIVSRVGTHRGLQEWITQNQNKAKKPKSLMVIKQKLK